MEKSNIEVVEVIDGKDDVVVKTVECYSLRNAEKTEDGMNINLNHAQYYTRIREVTPNV